MAKVNRKNFSFGFSYNSPVILTFALLSVISLLLNVITVGATNTMLFSVYRFRLTDVLGYLRLFLHVLGHTGYDHLASNICMMLVVGPLVEEKYGSKNVLISIAATAFVTGIVHILTSGSAMLGASGIVFMLILMASITNFRGGYIPLTLIAVAVIYLGNEFVDGVSVADNITQLGHIVGGCMGIVCGIFFNRKH